MKFNQPRKLDDIVQELCSSLGFEKAYQEHQAIKVWQDAVGDMIARQSRARYIKNSVLYVRVLNPAWRQELHFKKADIIVRINTSLGQDMVRDIVFQ
ncbi:MULTISPECIES: DUF721 domain-containing protein [Prosthecochloris]|uniref:DUF721 domain-containing protein n=1 Tax=Prosthecochloris vibrioformis TaxID=1098 RepID=A0A5C4S3D2_PROVB|nr:MULTISPECIES: DUF721 domain-containing protein [Prosthecochloris]ANT63827.1 Zn-ribbon-containing putative RNA-binding protein [Prosthecochloris sp. CIB 2401]TNJ37652.1 DUF721 domain-containing protein [Prosthecochloris vibrioformis]